ncbi:MAG TPA: hypothetical protein VHS35_06390 [Pseudonocardia sp.]|nr:hypothetical protein [Pseudonocardia sp.]
MPGDGSVVLELLIYVLVAATPTLMVWSAVRWLPPAIGHVLDLRLQRRRPTGPTLESVVGNLRRLRREVRGKHPTQVRHLALLSAYDQTLLQACGIVGVAAPLDGATEADRPFARLLTEAQLEEAGIALDPPGRAAA